MSGSALAKPQTEVEVHIAGVLVQTRPGLEMAVAASLSALPCTQIYPTASAGKLVAVCEGKGAGVILDLIDFMRDLSGVLNVALVYQHAENITAMEEEIGHETDSP